MIELHERLSEFSYGYGVTREAEILLEQTGIRAVPFLPSLIQEKKLGFDVKFDRPGTALMLQFKLGQSLSRFHNSSPVSPRPILDRPFWRFSINTAEPDGQFETLLRCLIPRFDGAILSLEWKEAVWDRYVTGAPRPRTLSEQQYSDRKLRSRR